MNIINSDLYRFSGKVIDFIMLNILWMIMSLPFITVFPATTAMFGVVREWIQGKNEGMFRSFFKHFKENFKQSVAVSIVWLMFGITFYINFYISNQLTGISKFLLISLMAFICLLFMMTSMYLFPVMVHFQSGWIDVVKNSLLFSISQLGTTILCILILLFAYFISYIIPITFLIVWSVTAYVIYTLCHRTFIKAELFIQEGDA